MSLTRERTRESVGCYISGQPEGQKPNRPNQWVGLHVQDLGKCVQHSPEPYTSRDPEGKFVVCQVPGAFREMFGNGAGYVLTAMKQAIAVQRAQKRSGKNELRTVEPSKNTDKGFMFCVGPNIRNGAKLFLPKKSTGGLSVEVLGRLRHVVEQMHATGCEHCHAEFAAADLQVQAAGTVIQGVWNAGVDVLLPTLGLTLGAWPKAHKDLDYTLGVAMVIDAEKTKTRGVHNMFSVI